MLRKTEISAKKYYFLYPIRDVRNLVTLGEGRTPLYNAFDANSVREDSYWYPLKDVNFLVKNEGLNPTGAFKDRGSMIEITKSIELGFSAVCLASTGNMAASVAAYSAKANRRCYVFTPEGTPIGKLAQTLSYGAKVLQIKGTYSEAASLVEAISSKLTFMLAGDYAFRQEGQKSQAYEIIEQLNYLVPDWVIVPMGCGTNISAIWKGFREFYSLGLIDSLPKLLGVQAKGCAPIVNAYENNLDEVLPIKNPDTIAGAIATGNPLDGRKALRAIRESKGFAGTVSDDEILEAQKILASTSATFAEPSGAVGVAAALKFSDKLYGRVVCLLTGNGLKDPVSALKLQSHPPSIEPRVEEAARIIQQGIFDIMSFIRGEERNKVVLEKLTDSENLLDLVKKELGISLEHHHLSQAQSKVNSFIRKGKTITKIDLKTIVEDVISAVPNIPEYLKIIDFEVADSLNELASATVRFVYDGKEQVASARGDGPVDASIRAIRQGLKAKANFELTDYSVSINSGGTEAVVEVTISLKSDSCTALAKATSPDIVVASLDAFVRAYNILNWKLRNQL